MKTITIDFELYVKEQDDIKQESYEKGYEDGVAAAQSDMIMEILEPAEWYGENWREEIIKAHPGIESIIYKVHGRAKK